MLLNKLGILRQYVRMSRVPCGHISRIGSSVGYHAVTPSLGLKSASSLRVDDVFKRISPVIQASVACSAGTFHLNFRNFSAISHKVSAAVSASNPSSKFSDRITIVDTPAKAKKALKVLKAHPDAVWACDTEVADIDVKQVGPVGNGYVTCVSLFGGPDIDFGDGRGTALWIDNMGSAAGVLDLFKPWFEDQKYKKSWHNYGFDRHVMGNMGINCGGFSADTFHMARLWDSSRDKASGGGEGYGLAALSTELVHDARLAKVSMKDIFGKSKAKKDGSDGKLKEMPSVRELQENPEHRDKWIEYSAKDAIATWWVRHELEVKLRRQDWIVDGKKLGNMYEFYDRYLKDFGELLTEMEKNGILVDTDVHLHQAEMRAREDRDSNEKRFMEWAAQYCPDAKYMNSGSSVQVGAFLFGHYEKGRQIAKERIFRIDKTPEEFAAEQTEAVAENPYINYSAVDIKAALKERGLKTAGKKAELVARLLAYDALPVKFQDLPHETLIDMCNSRGVSDDGTREELVERLTSDSLFVQKAANEHDRKEATQMELRGAPKKWREITINTIGLTPTEFSPARTPQVSAAVLRKLAGSNLEDEKNAVYGSIYKVFQGGKRGREACLALGALASVGQIESTITNFLVPLQALVDKQKRIHCSLNLNTETGRLSSRKPNLQNQPALEKDQYRIRDAFIAEPGNTLIVADYGQLELRLLAHITNCESMLTAFRNGGCFHSRTAVGMYDYIKKAVENKEVLLEWDYSKGQPTVPLVKDTYASERRKAKTLNFSIAYGKTVHGLALDWGISKEEAQETLDAWYRDRPEVRDWQDKTRAFAKKYGFVRTMMGRYRILHDAGGRGPSAGHALRAAINTPIQGSAADVVMMAMIKLWKSPVLKELKWKLLLQIHDEVILEGPQEHRDAAMAEVRACMEQPFDGFGLSPLKVFLDVDAKSADSWYKAK